MDIMDIQNYSVAKSCIWIFFCPVALGKNDEMEFIVIRLESMLS